MRSRETRLLTPAVCLVALCFILADVQIASGVIVPKQAGLLQNPNFRW